MRVVVQNTLTNRQWVAYDAPGGFAVGREPTCQVRLDSRFVSPVHARVERTEVAGANGSGWELELLPGANPVEVDSKPCRPGERATLHDGSVLRIMEFVLTFQDEAAVAPAGEEEAKLTALQNELHAAVLRRLDLRLGSWGGAATISADRADQLNRIVDDLLLGDFKTQVFDSELTPLILRRALRSRTVDWLYRRVTRQNAAAGRADGPGDGATGAEWSQLGINPDMEATIESAVVKLAAKAGIVDNKPLPLQAEELLDQFFDSTVGPIIDGLLDNVRRYLIISATKKTLYDVIFGLGPLEDLLRSPTVTEVMVVSPKLIYIERNGRVVRVPQSFPSDEATVSIIERIVAPLGRRIDRSQPLVDARLRDGSRVNAIIEPLAIKGPCITIRKFPLFRVSVDDLIRWKSITGPAVALLRACILQRASLLISGGTGSGKTTLLNVLSGMIPSHERLVTIEDSAELRLQQEHVVSLETKPANSEGKGQYTVRDLVKNSLRMRPDRIIVGECRGDEAVDMLQAMNTGHQGSMTTIHANSTQDAIARIETMVLMGAEIPLPAVRRQIASAIQIIVHVERLGSGQRLVSQISEVMGLHPLSGEVETRDILRAVEQDGVMALRPTGFMPRFLGEMVENGYLQLGSWLEQSRQA
jgi:pilus assembly protein CpaF